MNEKADDLVRRYRREGRNKPTDMFGNDLTKTDSFGTPREDKPCEACLGVGWLLMDNSDHGLRIERCDSCQMFSSDEEAVTFVAKQARKALDRA